MTFPFVQASVEVSLPAEAMQTYAILRPLHTLPATCEDYECEAYLQGWSTLVDEATDLGQRQAYYIRHDRSRKHYEARTEAGLTEFTFPPGQQGFGHQHKIPISQQRFYLMGGDRRGNPRGLPTHRLTPEQWVDDFGEHQETLAERIQRG